QDVHGEQNLPIAAHQEPRCTTSSIGRCPRRSDGDRRAGAGEPPATQPIGVNSAGTPKALRNDAVWSGGTPKKHAPSSSSTALSSMSSVANPASISQYGTGHRASSRSVQPLSGSAYRSRYACLCDSGTISSGAFRMSRNHESAWSDSGTVAVQNRSRSSGVDSTRNAHPCEKPADGARSALASSRSTTASGTGRDGS